MRNHHVGMLGEHAGELEVADADTRHAGADGIGADEQHLPTAPARGARDPESAGAEPAAPAAPGAMGSGGAASIYHSPQRERIPEADAMVDRLGRWAGQSRCKAPGVPAGQASP